MAAPAIPKLSPFRRWSCSTPATCGESFFSIGQMIQLSCYLLKLLFRLRTACRVGYRTHARGIDAIFLDQVRDLVRILHHSSLQQRARFLRVRSIRIAKRLPGSGKP
jgi:hypothetical protein